MLFGKKTCSTQWIVAFLGNPGTQYEKTRHNMGFQTAHQLEERLGIKIDRLKFHALTANVSWANQQVLLMKPQTFMNNSGEAVGEASRFYKIPVDHVLIVYDDVSIPVGKLRVRPNGSAGGHNGIKSIVAHLNSQDFPRVRIGVGSPEHPEFEMVDWVIGVPTLEEQKTLKEIQKKALDAVEHVMNHGVPSAMNSFN